MAAAAQLLLSLVVLSVFSFSSALPSQTMVNAAEILSDSGYTSMALTLDLASSTVLISRFPSLTIFAPNNAAFSFSGQPPLTLLEYHLLPQAFSLQSLKSLPFSAKISTLLSGYSLTITTSSSDRRVSLNNVTLPLSPIFDDGSLIIFGIGKFLDPYFRISGPIRSYNPKNLVCLAQESPNEPMEVSDGHSPFNEASNALRSRGCSVMASFLEMQFHGFFSKYETMVTVFAPFDQVLMNRVGNLSEQSSIFHRHVVPCKLLWSDLVSLNDGTMLRTNLMGFTINITRSEDVLMVNGVTVILPEVYHNGWLVVHGISEVLELPERTEQSEETAQSEETDESEETEESEDLGVAPSVFDDSFPEEEVVEEEEESAITHNNFFVVRPGK